MKLLFPTWTPGKDLILNTNKGAMALQTCGRQTASSDNLTLNLNSMHNYAHINFKDHNSGSRIPYFEINHTTNSMKPKHKLMKSDGRLGGLENTVLWSVMF